MATKYLLIPEDLYNNLLKSQQNNVIGTEFASNNLSKVKKSKNKNASAKNVLYNQELRRYLKTKKEEEEKPIKVEVSNGLKGLTKKNPPVITNSPVSSIETPIQPRISYPLQIINEEDEDKQNENFEGDFEPQTFSAKFLNKSYHETPKTTNMYHTRLERMMKIINENPDAFQVRDNRILNKFGNYILKSNVLESVNHILNVSSEHTFGSPPGTANLLSKLRAHTATREILSEKRSKQLPNRIYRRWQKNQQGEGVIKRLKNLKKISTKFKPQLWMKN